MSDIASDTMSDTASDTMSDTTPDTMSDTTPDVASDIIVGDLPPAASGAVSFYIIMSGESAQWSRLLELFLHPPGSSANDSLLVGMHPLENMTWPLGVVDIPESSVAGALALAQCIGLSPKDGVPVISTARGVASPPPRGARTYFIPPPETEAPTEDWDAAKITEAMRAAGFSAPEDWVARFFPGRATAESAMTAFGAWINDYADLPEEIVSHRG